MTASPAPPAREIPVVDVRDGGPVRHAALRRDAMLELREACFSVVPVPLRGIARPLDRISAAWLKASPSPYVGEIAEIAVIAQRPGVWFVNASYEWGCTTRIDVEPVPTLRRTLDWPFPGLGRHVEIALQDGGAGLYANVTWPGAVGVLTAVAPGRFAAAINQAPLYRRTQVAALLPADFLLNGVATWRSAGRWPAAHLLRRAFDACATFEAAVELLAEAPLARPALISIVGAEPGQGCLIERTETAAHVHRGSGCIANGWHPAGPARPGHWRPRGRFVRGVPDSEDRRARLGRHACERPLDWLQEPVLNGLTRLGVEASPATGALRVLGFEPTSRRMTEAVPATRTFEGIVTPDGLARAPDRDAA
ncbi:MAG TPA: hypothetical protein VF601_20530 [Beijerinckiaceae bacterium]|jgi:hypothetical protein